MIAKATSNLIVRNVSQAILVLDMPVASSSLQMGSSFVLVMLKAASGFGTGKRVKTIER
jgi:hypothetical protein